MHFYEFNIGDYAKKTPHLSNEEDLAYRRALDLYYDTEKPLDIQNIPALSRRLRVTQEALKAVIDEFFPEGKNKHADEKISAYHAYLLKQSENGKKGGRPKNQQVTSEKNPPLNAGQPPDNPAPSQQLTNNHKPITKNQEPIEKNSRAKALSCPQDVDRQVWDDYMAIRKAKRSPLTETALKNLRKEADKAGVTLNYAIQECVTRGWQGFKASWFADRKGRTPAEQEESERRFREWIGDDGAIDGEIVT